MWNDEPVEEELPARQFMTASRLEAFSDGVLAVIITLTALSIKPPNGATLHALGHQLPVFLIYVLSFTYIGIYWVNHHHLLRSTERINGAVMWANLALLFWLSLTPVLTQWMGTHYRNTEPAVCYGAAALAAAASYTALVRAIIAVNPGSTVAVSIGEDRKGRVSLLLYVLAVAGAFVTPYIAYALFATVSVMWFVPDRRLVA